MNASVAVIFESVKELLSILSLPESHYERIVETKNTIIELLDIIGIIYELSEVRTVSIEEKIVISDEYLEDLIQRDDLEDSDIDNIVRKRLEFKSNKNFNSSDKLRDFLNSRNIDIRDGKEASEWSRKK